MELFVQEIIKLMGATVKEYVCFSLCHCSDVYMKEAVKLPAQRIIKWMQLSSEPVIYHRNRGNGFPDETEN